MSNKQQAITVAIVGTLFLAWLSNQRGLPPQAPEGQIYSEKPKIGLVARCYVGGIEGDRHVIYEGPCDKPMLTRRFTPLGSRIVSGSIEGSYPWTRIATR